jgi:hypothetical protein
VSRARVASAVARGEWLPLRVFGAAVAGASVLGGLLAGALVLDGSSPLLQTVPLLVLLIVLWFRPDLGPILLVFAAATIEQFPYLVGSRDGAATDKIPFFHGFDPSIHFTPADLLLLTLVVICLVKRDQSHSGLWPKTVLGRCILALLAAVALGVVVGLEHHGTVRVALMEVRPFVYLGAAYLVATSLIRSPRTINAVLWALVLGTGFKALQGILIFLQVRHVQPRPDAVLAHEEAFFFGLFLILTFALWLFEIRGPLRTTATLLVLPVLAADLVNSRRTAFLILAMGIVALSLIGYVSLPHRRRFLRRFGACTVLATSIYLPVYWNHTGGLAQPARAIHSAISPDPRDESSDLYRVQENANLKLNIREGGLLGRGFGVPIDYRLPIADISSIDPLIAYIPHNGVLYIFMRIGALGAIVFWALLGAGIVGGCALARSRRRELGFIGAVFACALLAYAVQGYNDHGFFFYRIAIVVGVLAGIFDRARRWAADDAKIAAAEGT